MISPVGEKLRLISYTGYGTLIIFFFVCFQNIRSLTSGTGSSGW